MACPGSRGAWFASQGSGVVSVSGHNSKAQILRTSEAGTADSARSVGSNTGSDIVSDDAATRESNVARRLVGRLAAPL